MKHNFSVTPTINAPRSMFNRSFAHKTSFDAGWLIPVFHDEVLPGDTMNLRATMMARMATPKFPVMDNMYLDSHFFFVPYRLLWTNWRKFCGEQVDPGDSIDYSIPVLSGTTQSNPEGSLSTEAGKTSLLMDYLGIPDTVAPDDVDISALPFRAYSRIYSEWFRDQNIIDSPDGASIDGDGPDNYNVSSNRHFLHRRGKRHDFFTQALPWPQKGDAVSLPLSGTADIDYVTGANPTQYVRNPSNDLLSGAGDLGIDSGGTSGNLTLAGTATRKVIDLNGSHVVDLTTATAATINDLREAFQIQKLLERDARGGTRYSEIIRNHFNVNFYDVSYRPEYLGGGSQRININPVAATGGVETDRSTGDLGAYAVSVGDNHAFTKSFVEHGIVMGLVSVRADLTYQQGLSRFFSHSTRYDKYWPSLAHLGEQSLLTKEIYCTSASSATDDVVFGYVPRYDEYRYKPSMITGMFKSTASASLDSWHLSQEFSSAPTLSQTFIEEDPPIDRVIQVTSEPHFIFDSFFDIKHARPIPTFGTPGMIDHF
jgi:hypothetical protein